MYIGLTTTKIICPKCLKNLAGKCPISASLQSAAMRKTTTTMALTGHDSIAPPTALALFPLRVQILTRRISSCLLALRTLRTTIFFITPVATTSSTGKGTEVTIMRPASRSLRQWMRMLLPPKKLSVRLAAVVYLLLTRGSTSRRRRASAPSSSIHQSRVASSF